MKIIIFFFLGTAVVSTTWAQFDGLIIGEVVDGTNFGGTPKYVELYNAHAVNSYNIGGLEIRRYANGNTTPATLTITSGVILDPGETWVVADASFDSNWGGAFATEQPDATNGSIISGNGNDVYALSLSDGTILDVFGVVGTDGTGEAWEYTDSQAFRDPSTNDGNDGIFDVNEWVVISYSNSNASPGSHTITSSLPVELFAFDAVLDGDAAQLRWETASETNNAGFEVQHLSEIHNPTLVPAQAGIQNWNVLGWIDGHGTTEVPQAYTYRVVDLTPGIHRFRLKQIDYDGAFEYSPEVEVVVEMSGLFQASRAYPNPFNPETNFSLTIAREQHVQVAVYDVLARRVALLHDGFFPAQTARSFVFDAGLLPSGLYVIHVQGEYFTTTQLVTLLK